MTPESPAVCVIVLSWNGGAVLKECLASLRAQTRATRVIVVDNGSTDGSQDLVRREFPEMTLIENGRNLGFGEGNNVGIRAAMDAGAQYVALLNQDARADRDWIAALVRAAEADVSIGAVASRLVLHSHQSLLNGAGVVMNLSGCAWDRGFARADGPQWCTPCDVLAATGGAVLYRTDALRRVGLLDAAYFAYFEDVDLSVRLWDAGFRVVYAPDAVATHRFSFTLGDESFGKILLIQSNRWRFILKHFSLGRFRHPKTLMVVDKHFARNRLRLGPRGLKLWLRVYARVLSFLPGVLRYRFQHPTTKERRARWWQFVAPTAGFPDVFMPAIDYDLMESPAEAWTNRVIMGVNDTALGQGWYPLFRPEPMTFAEPEGPALRDFGSSATCFLRVAAPGPHVVQVHVTQRDESRDARDIEIRCNGETLGRADVSAEPRAWRTVQFPVTLTSDTAVVELRVERPLLREESGAQVDYGVRVNEVSVLPSDSPLLRRLRAAPSH
ncbi:MAG: glycosyltransferase family 2 protein [Acidobacteria bacterium]|nr:glycosyltransferase family 2 protein [Acidobacteriota bacterium]